MLSAITFQPGISLDDTDSHAETRFVSGDKVRFRRGKAQIIGGWESISSDTFDNPVRGAHAWATGSGDRAIAFGDATKLYSLFTGNISNITPLKGKGTLVDPFATVNGSPTVTVTDTDHGFKTDDSVIFSLADAVGGITPDGTYTITVLNIDLYQITHGSNATSTVGAGGGNVEFTCVLDAGKVDGTAGTGWGTGTYSSGYYGLPTSGDTNPRCWSIENWGTNCLALPRDGALYEWQPYASYDTILTNGTFTGDASGWTLGTGWAYGTNAVDATAGTASLLTQDVTGIMYGGVVYSVAFTVSNYSAGTIQFQLTGEAGTVNHGAAISKDGTYTRRFYAPSLPTGWHIYKDNAFAGTIDTVVTNIESTAYRIQGAPQYSTCMFVDPNRFVVCCGTTETDGDWNPLAVRWSAQEDNTTWIADTTNLAGEFILGRGSRIVGAISTRGMNLIFTDESVYSMRFTGSSSNVFRFDLVGTGCGLLGMQSVCEHQGQVFWWGRNGQFYGHRGGEPLMIVSPIQETTWENISPSQQEKVAACVNAQFNEIWWFYPDSRDGNECSRYVAYNWREEHWSTGIMDRTSWITAGVYENPVAFSPTTTKAYWHEKSDTADGATLDWHLTTGKFNIGDGEQMMAVSRYIPDFQSQTGNITVTMSFYEWPRGDKFLAYSGTITPTTSELLPRHLGREATIKWEDGTNSRYARWGVQRLEIKPTGAKR